MPNRRWWPTQQYSPAPASLFGRPANRLRRLNQAGETASTADRIGERAELLLATLVFMETQLTGNAELSERDLL